MEKEKEIIVILGGRREFANEKIYIGIKKSTLEACNLYKQKKVMGDNLSSVWGSNFEVVHPSSSVHLIRKEMEKSLNDKGLDVKSNDYRWMWENLIPNLKSNRHLAKERLAAAKEAVKDACEYKIYKSIVLV